MNSLVSPKLTWLPTFRIPLRIVKVMLMEEALVSSSATDENSFTTHGRTLRKDTEVHEIPYHVKLTSQCHNPENYSTSSIQLKKSL